MYIFTSKMGLISDDSFEDLSVMLKCIFYQKESVVITNVANVHEWDLLK